MIKPRTDMNKIQGSITKIIVVFPILIACIGSLAYIIFGLTSASVWAVIIVSAITTFLLCRKNNQVDETSFFSSATIPQREWLIFFGYLFVWLISFWLLYSARTDRAIITPWQVVSHWYFITFSLGTLLTWFLVKSSSRFTKYVLILHSLLLCAVATIVYQIGYGFDPYIHEAAIKAIIQLGKIKPLTPYYLGYYSLIIALKTISGLSIHFWTRILIPLLSSVLIPLLVTRWLSRHHGTEKNWMAAALLLFILPASLFIVSTPQGLAYLFLLIVILWPSPQLQAQDKIIICIAALAALLTQPIAGIAASFIVLYDLTKNSKQAKVLYNLCLAGLVLAIPFSLYVVSRIDSATSSSFVIPQLQWLSDYIPQNPFKYSIWLNLSYLFNGLQGLLVLLLLASGVVLAFQRKSKELRLRYAWPFLALALAAIVASSLNFHFLIDYERSDYPQRILITACLVALPLLIAAFETFARKLNETPKTVMYSILLVITGAITANLYVSYPRYDDIHNSHSYATSKADVLAVQWIDKDAQTKSYLVLSNQQVSAAALSQFGFAHYLKNNIFYYPVPTGGILYPYYLKTVDQPQRSTIEEAMKVAGVQKAYVVLNNYWWRFKYLAPDLQKIADSSISIGDGQDVIYSFSLTK